MNIITNGQPPGPGYKPHLAFLFLLMLASSVFAQKTQDVVHLHNGSMVRGQLIERIDGSHVKIETVDGSIWVFPMSDVKEVGTAKPLHKKNTFELREKGFYNLSDVGILAGRSGNQSINSLSAHTVCGYQLNKHFAAGLGVGIEKFDIALAPVFAEGRYYVLKGRFSPFIALQGGYGIPMENYRDQENEWINKGGIMAGANIGIRNYLSSNIGFVVSAGFRHQQSITKQDWWWLPVMSESSVIHQYNRLVFRIGFLFN